MMEKARVLPNLDDLADLLANAKDIAVQRAVSELRTGRPVLLDWAGAPVLVAAIDTLSPRVYATFRATPGAALVLTCARAAALGAPSLTSIQLPLASLDQPMAEALAAAPAATLAGLAPSAASRAADAALDLCKRAHLLPAMLVAPLRAGTAPAILHRLTEHELAAIATPEDPALEIVSSAAVPLVTTPARFVVFRSPASARDQVAIIIGDPDPADIVPVRLHSACLTGDLFGSLRCDCGDQLRQAIDALGTGGILLYLDQEGRGIGLRNKMRAYALQDEGLDTIDADGILGYGPDERSYAIAAAMLHQLGFTRIRLLTNNPGKLAALSCAGIEVLGHTPLLAPITTENRRYLEAKAGRGGHMLQALFSAAPSRD